MLRVFFALFALIFIGCGNSNKVDIDGKKVFLKSCVVCHNDKIPPEIPDDEKAPPMVSVVLHLKDFMKKETVNTKERFINFVIEYAKNPNKSSAYCDEQSIKKYGLMPKINLKDEELKAVANYIYRYYTARKLQEMLKRKIEFDKKSDAEKIAIKYNCFSCHKIDKKL